MRLFIAIRVPLEAHAAVRIAAGCLKGALGARLLAPESWHITLKFLGEMPDGGVGEISDALSEIRFSPFQIRLCGAGAYPGRNTPRAIWIGGESQEAGELAEKVESALSFLSLPRERFKLHLTVARSRGIADIDEFLRTKEVCSFWARSFCLMKSTLAAREAIHEVLKEFPAEGNREG